MVTWGDSYYGGDSTSDVGTLTGVTSSVATQLSSGVVNIFSTIVAFAALKEDGSVVTWGDDDSGGDSESVATQLSSGVVNIFSTYDAFAALKEDGSVVTWGDEDSGGYSKREAQQLKSL